jgi:acetyl-CoA carboxylase carboxyltransferase component
VKAGSWGWRTVEKIIRIQETAHRLRVPMLYLVDSAGARITDQIEMFPARRGAGKIFFNQTKLGRVPQVCLLDPRPAALTSRRSATSCSWSTRMRRCTSARRAWPRW